MITEEMHALTGATFYIMHVTSPGLCAAQQ